MATTITGSGVDNIIDGTIVNADINASAAIVGSKLSGAGKVLQVVQVILDNTTNGNFFLDTSSTSFVPSSFTASITPMATNSKILISTVFQFYHSNNSSFTLFRDSTNLGGSTYGFGRYTGANNVWLNVPITYLDSPATTSAITYKVGGRCEAGNLYIGGDGNAKNSITLMEISG
jgi:hypothetical protein